MNPVSDKYGQAMVSLPGNSLQSQAYSGLAQERGSKRLMDGAMHQMQQSPLTGHSSGKPPMAHRDL